VSRLKSLRFALPTFALILLVAVAPSAGAFANDKRSRERHDNKKSEKFVNGHDARDGRRDGRGPKFKSDNWRHSERRENHFRNANWRRNEWRNRRVHNANWRHHRRLRHRR
jgi:hypothetical protein